MRLPEEHGAWLAAAKAGDQKAMERLLHFHRRLIQRTAGKFARAEMDDEDILQECRMAFVLAVRDYDETRRTAFGTVAWTYMRNKVIQMLRATRATIRLPKGLWEDRRRIWAAGDRLFTQLGREPTHEELAQETGIALHRVIAALSAPKVTLSLDEYCGFEDVGEGIAAHIAHTNDRSLEETFLSALDDSLLYRTIEKMGEPYISILQLRYGLDGAPRLTMIDVGAILKLSPFSVSQLEREALAYLREHLKGDLG